MGASAFKICLLSSTNVCVEIRYMLHISTLKGKIFFGNYAVQKSKFRFLHVIVADFRHPLKNVEGGLPK
jgi:thiamine transporter ThiT